MSLWADPPEEEEPRSGGDRARVLWAGHEDEPPPEEEVAKEPEQPPRPDAPRRIPNKVVIVAAVVGLLVALAAVPDRGTLLVDDVPSAWGNVPMRCYTARIENPGRALELFRCRALGGAPLPAGLYRSPESSWTSDITRIDARRNEMRISRDVLTGWAVY